MSYKHAGLTVRENNYSSKILLQLQEYYYGYKKANHSDVFQVENIFNLIIFS